MGAKRQASTQQRPTSERRAKTALVLHEPLVILKSMRVGMGIATGYNFRSIARKRPKHLPHDSSRERDPNRLIHSRISMSISHTTTPALRKTNGRMCLTRFAPIFISLSQHR